MSKCPLCKTESQTSGDSLNQTWNCPNCGIFILTDRAAKSLPSEEVELSLISHILGSNKSRKATFQLNQANLKQILETQSLPTVAQKLENLIFALGSRIRFLAQYVVGEALHNCRAEVGAVNSVEFMELIEYLQNSGLVEGKKEPNLGVKKYHVATLTVSGWLEYEKIRHGEGEANLAFMAMPFGKEDLDKVYNEVWQPAAEKAGFKLERVDERPTAGPIDDRIRQRIRRAQIMVCELTQQNHGAYWEAGFAEGVGIPVIYTCRTDEKDKIHFDINHHQYIEWNEANLSESAELLTAMIQETLKLRVNKRA